MTRTILQIRQGLCLSIAEHLEIEFGLRNVPKWDVDEAGRHIDMMLPDTHDEALLRQDETDQEIKKAVKKQEGPSLRLRLEEALGFRPEDKIDLRQLLEAAIERCKGAKPHLACGSETSMGRALSETYSRDPKFYGATFCYACGKHFPLRDMRPESKFVGYGWAFLWSRDGEPVGSTEAEAREFKDQLAAEQSKRETGAGI